MTQVVIKDKAVDDFLSECVAAFADLCPALYDDFRGFVRDQSNGLHKSTGMSTEGHFRNHLHLPATVYHFIRAQARKRLGIANFWADPKNYTRLCRVWPHAKTKTRPRAFVDLGGSSCRQSPQP